MDLKSRSSEGWLAWHNVRIVLVLLLVPSEEDVGDGENNDKDNGRIHGSFFFPSSFLGPLFLLVLFLLFLLQFLLVFVLLLLVLLEVPVTLLVQLLLVVVLHKVLIESIFLLFLKFCQTLVRLVNNIFDLLNLILSKVFHLSFEVINKHIIVGKLVKFLSLGHVSDFIDDLLLEQLLNFFLLGEFEFPLAFNCIWEARITLILQDVLDIRVAYLERESDARAVTRGMVFVHCHMGHFGLHCSEAMLLPVDQKMVLVQRIDHSQIYFLRVMLLLAILHHIADQCVGEEDLDLEPGLIVGASAKLIERSVSMEVIGTNHVVVFDLKHNCRVCFLDTVVI